MNGARVFEDAYSGVFREQEDFFSCLHEIMGKSLWIRQKVRNLRLVPIIAGSTFEKELRSQYTEDGMDDGIISDTIANTALMLKYRGDMLPVRDCAIKSILDRAGIQGSGLRRVERNVYARILNDVLKVTKGEALLRISEGKVSAVLSGDCNDYAILNMEEIFLHTMQYLQEEFEGSRYMAGFYEHDMVSAMWSIDESGLLSAYSRELSLLGKTTEDMIPMVRVTTSDTGTCGANIYPMLLNVKDGKSVNLGSPLKLVHKNGSTMADYDAQLKKLYAKYQLAIGKLTELLEVRIANPVNCMTEVMAKLAIPKKYQAEALELFKAQYNVWSCTAHDIYFAISEILFMLECEGASGSRIAKMEEQIARALSMNWAEYDFPEM